MLRKALPALWLAAAAMFGSATAAQAQHREHPEHTYGFRCAYDSAQQDQFRRNPGMEQDYRNFLRRVGEMTPAEQARLNALPDVTVPVVVHVIHNGGTSNISDGQVIDAIRILNRDFNKENPDTADIDSRFVAIASRPGFKFKLAQKDPNGNCTNGITHTYSTQTLVGDNNVKNVIRWDQSRYLNIWVCERANGAGGYAFLPCTGGVNDGIVITNQQFGSIGRSCRSNFCIRSLTHEVGHYFGLPHTWGGTNTPGDPANCGLDDGIADTPNTVGAMQNCNVNEATCGPVANTENYMDYATCARMFTIGQRAVMRTSLTSTCRATLVSAANLVATGTNDGYTPPTTCPPVAAFSVTSSIICPGGSVEFVDGSYGNIGTASYAWSFPGGTPSSATTQNATVTYAAPGTYTATLTITGTGGTSTVTQQQIVRVLGANAAIPAAYNELFENDNWLANPTDADKNWRNEAAPGGTERWARVTGVNGPSQNGNSALRLRPTNISPGAVTALYTPLFNLTANGSATDNQILFDYAYARLTANSSDLLRVAFSSDCGATWTSNANIPTSTLVSNTGGQPVTGSFVPTASEWRTRTINVPPVMQNAARLMVRIEQVAGGGNNLFLDNFRVASATATRAREMSTRNFSVLPNPLTQETAVQFTLDQPETTQVQVQDLVGRTVFTLPAQRLGAGQQRVVLGAAGKRLSPGVYLVQLRVGQQRLTSRVLVQ